LGLSIDQEIIPLTQKDLSCDLPLVSGIQVEREGVESGMLPEPYHRWSNFRVEKALEFYKTLSAIDSGSVELLAEINMKDISNLTLYLLSGIKVMMGSDDFEKKWKRVRAVLGGGERIQEFVCLDLRFDDQVVLIKRSKASTLPKSQNHEGT
jgi:cell division septal protein FtsQ